MKLLYIIVTHILPLGLAAPTANGPSVTFSVGTIIGTNLLGVHNFKGIPFAQPPVGSLRLKPPQPLNSSLGTIQSQLIPQGCPQFFSQANTGMILDDVIADLLNSPFLQKITSAGEDCLTLNVQRPATATAGSNLPVVFWMFGGGLEIGSTQLYDGTELIASSVTAGQDVIFVATNYRTGGFGFLGGKEILADGSSNLGLLDQHMALEWVADNIESFGGDPSKVTIWGESSGSISVHNQMVLYNGNNIYKSKPLFRAAIMDSGSITPVNPIDSPKAQAIYDQVVSQAGCSSSDDTLNCLRGVDYTKFLTAVTSVPPIFSFSSIALSYLPRPDGVLLAASPEVLLLAGNITGIPFIIGDQEDEGTLFSLEQTNISTTADIENYLSTLFFPNASATQIQQLVATYPDNPSAGSPFNQGAVGNIYLQFKRLAALLGDSFTLRRRGFLAGYSQLEPNISTYLYLNSYSSDMPILGTFHASDILQVFGELQDGASASVQDYYLSFINDLDPNTGKAGKQLSWPEWGEGNMLMQWKDFGVLDLGRGLLSDTFRNESFNVLVPNQASFRT